MEDYAIRKILFREDNIFWSEQLVDRDKLLCKKERYEKLETFEFNFSVFYD